MREYRISNAGQMTFPAHMRTRWGIESGTSKIKAADLQEGVLMIADGVEWALVEAFYPESELLQRAKQKLNLYVEGNFDQQASSSEVEIFKPYKISKSGQLSFPASARTRWRIQEVHVHDLKSGLAVVPVNESQKTLPRVLPVDLFERDNWAYNQDGRLTPFLQTSYDDWQEEQGRNLFEVMIWGGSVPQDPNAANNTPLSRQLESMVIRDSSKVITKIAQEKMSRKSL